MLRHDISKEGDFRALDPEITASIEDALAKLPLQPAKYKLGFQALANRAPEHLEIICLRQLGVSDPSEKNQVALDWLVSRNRYFPLLMNSDFLPLAEAQCAARHLNKADARFLTNFPKLTNRSEPAGEAELLRALEIVEGLERYDALLLWLRGLYQSTNLRVQSKAAKLFYRFRGNGSLLGEELPSSNARARANAVEALWKSDAPWAANVFRSALSDSVPRVVLNAVIGLYYLDDGAIFDGLSELSRHPAPEFRAAVVWALHKIASPPHEDARAKELLQQMAADPVEAIREKVARSLECIGREPQA
jgi:hypothetical protein